MEAPLTPACGYDPSESTNSLGRHTTAGRPPSRIEPMVGRHVFNLSVTATAAAVVLSSCGAGGGAGIYDGLAPVTTSTVPTRPSTAPDRTALRIGEQSDTREGNVVKVISYEQPVPPALLEAQPGMEYGAAEVEMCAGRNGARRVSAEAFRVEMADGTEHGRTFFGPSEPAFVDVRLAPQACARGWLNFEVPKGIRPAYVAFRGSTVARWRANGS